MTVYDYLSCSSNVTPNFCFDIESQIDKYLRFNYELWCSKHGCRFLPLFSTRYLIDLA